MEKNFFQELYDVDIRDRMYDKQGVTYVPWATSWSEVAKRYPDSNYEIVKFGEKQLPYTESDLGIMVYTRVTVNGITREMCLPVMDSTNKAMKTYEYTYKTKSGEKTVAAATMFDVSKTIMRCLAKNLAMFGIALHLWSKDEAPESVVEREKLQQECMEQISKKAKLSEEAKKKVAEYCKAADENANGDPRLIEDIEVLKKLKTQLMGIRK